MSLNDFLSRPVSLGKAVGKIAIFTAIFTYCTYKVIDFEFAKRQKRLHKKVVSYIIQTGPQKEALASEYFAELLGLATDVPVPFSLFDCKKASETLLSSPVLSEVSVKKIAPNMVYIDYNVRKPFVSFIDFYNTALDSEGRILPVHPFFSPKKMTEVFLGEGALQNTPVFGEKIEGYFIDLAFSVLRILTESGEGGFFPARIDVSRAKIESLGKREIVVMLENERSFEALPGVSFHFLRLTPKRYQEEIADYLRLRPSLLEAERDETGNLKQIIDLRLSGLAFIENKGV